jgi:hypothetical protein
LLVTVILAPDLTVIGSPNWKFSMLMTLAAVWPPPLLVVVGALLVVVPPAPPPLVVGELTGGFSFDEHAATAMAANKAAAAIRRNLVMTAYTMRRPDRFTGMLMKIADKS